jgi:hypothetical protein
VDEAGAGHLVGQGRRGGRALGTRVARRAKIAGLFGVLVQDRYCDVPRGRVMLEGKERHGVIIHGNGTDGVALLQIARAFNLAKWTAETDEHYLVGDEANRLFTLEFEESED